MTASSLFELSRDWPMPPYSPSSSNKATGDRGPFSLPRPAARLTLPDMKIKQLHALQVRIPQKPPIAPYQSRYRASSEKEAVIIRLETDTGLVGWGEMPVDWIKTPFEGSREPSTRR